MMAKYGDATVARIMFAGPDNFVVLVTMKIHKKIYV